MFTGIVTDIGEITRVERRGDMRVDIRTSYGTKTIVRGASICCAGCCLTVIETSATGFSVDVSGESIARTNLAHWKVGTRINLERALKMGDELGGHMVLGHVDGVGNIVSVKTEGDSKRFLVRVPKQLARFIAEKGSVTLDGVALTVNEVDGLEFGVNIIPHTQAVTTWGHVRAGDAVNVEIDMLARYVARLAEFEKS